MSRRRRTDAAHAHARSGISGKCTGRRIQLGMNIGALRRRGRGRAHPHARASRAGPATRIS